MMRPQTARAPAPHADLCQGAEKALLQELTDRLNDQAVVIAGLESRIKALEKPPVTLEQRRRNGEMERMSPGWPFWLPSSDRLDDYKGLEECDCPRCGHHGQVPRYWHRDEPRQYASFAVCPDCWHSEPF